MHGLLSGSAVRVIPVGIRGLHDPLPGEGKITPALWKGTRPRCTENDSKPRTDW